MIDSLSGLILKGVSNGIDKDYRLIFIGRSISGGGLDAFCNFFGHGYMDAIFSLERTL